VLSVPPAFETSTPIITSIIIFFFFSSRPPGPTEPCWISLHPFNETDLRPGPGGGVSHQDERAPT
jgi:hypothetical protein